MKRIAGLLLFLTFALGANAGSITIYNRTAVPMYMTAAHIHSSPPPGMPIHDETALSYMFPPGVTVFYYATPSDFIYTVTGTAVSLPATSHLSHTVFRIGSSSDYLPVYYMGGPYEIDCVYYGLRFRATVSMGPGPSYNQVIDITTF